MNHNRLFAKLAIRFFLRTRPACSDRTNQLWKRFKGLPLSREEFDATLHECVLEGTVTTNGDVVQWHEESIGLVEVLHG
jgi:hypothetical protein